MREQDGGVVGGEAFQPRGREHAPSVAERRDDPSPGGEAVCKFARDLILGHSRCALPTGEDERVPFVATHFDEQTVWEERSTMLASRFAMALHCYANSNTKRT